MLGNHVVHQERLIKTVLWPNWVKVPLYLIIAIFHHQSPKRRLNREEHREILFNMISSLCALNEKRRLAMCTNNMPLIDSCIECDCPSAKDEHVGA